jgi:DNA-binding NarL/FixJ family response regulator
MNNGARGLGVVLVDQIPLFRDGLSNMVAHTPGLRWLGSTQNVHAAVVMSERLKPDIMIIDSVLDPRSHLTKLLVSASSNLTVISLVRDPHRTSQYVSEALTAGAHGVILRSAEPGQLADAIRRSCTERRYIDPALSTLTKGIRTRTPGARQPLSRREYQVLQLIADGLENQAIAKALFVSVETIRTHVKSILRKLHARDRAHAVAIAFRLGVLVAHGEGSFPNSVNGSVPSTASALRPARQL